MSTNLHLISESKETEFDRIHQVPLQSVAFKLERRKVEMEIQNVVATADLNQNLELETILRIMPGAKYSPERFPGLIYRLKRPRVTTLLFRSGKVVCTGAKSVRSGKNAITQLINELTGRGIVIIRRPSAEIENIVASGDLRGMIDLESVAERLFRTIYEPEQFPALIYRMSEPKVVFLIFASGKIVCTGAKTEADVHTAVKKLRDTLQLNELITCNEADIREPRSNASLIETAI
jgi:transcription initiation factor TFIID TATA-box-binding protein